MKEIKLTKKQIKEIKPIVETKDNYWIKANEFLDHRDQLGKALWAMIYKMYPELNDGNKYTLDKRTFTITKS